MKIKISRLHLKSKIFRNTILLYIKHFITKNDNSNLLNITRKILINFSIIIIQNIL